MVYGDKFPFVFVILSSEKVNKVIKSFHLGMSDLRDFENSRIISLFHL